MLVVEGRGQGVGDQERSGHAGAVVRELGSSEAQWASSWLSRGEVTRMPAKEPYRSLRTQYRVSTRIRGKGAVAGSSVFAYFLLQLPLCVMQS